LISPKNGEISWGAQRSPHDKALKDSRKRKRNTWKMQVQDGSALKGQLWPQTTGFERYGNIEVERGRFCAEEWAWD